MGRKLFHDRGTAATLGGIAPALRGGAMSMACCAAAALTAARPAPASACGGFFCSAANPVNQAAEQIIFAENGDGTVTAVIQIMYEGPSEQFAWVLPVPGVPEIGVSSDQALDTLKQFTNPSYQLNTSFGSSCGFAGGAGTGASGNAPPQATPDTAGPGGVSVQASGAIGPYLYDVIAVDSTLADPADAAIKWLTENSYDVGELGPDVLRPYLEDGLNLIAFKLQKGNSSGSIRPVMLTYDSALPVIPIRPTAVAANDDMGVMVWVLSSARAIPKNYKALELNEALIDWFNPMNNYNEVVSRAADEAQGQGFVTEYADRTQMLFNNGLSIFADFQEQAWSAFMSGQHDDPVAMVQEANQNWAGWDGMDEALRGAVMLPDTISFDDFRRCMRCYIGEQGVVFDTTLYLTGLYEKVIKPMADTQALLESRPYITRLYTTMSADEMTVDPVFDFNSDLPTVSNVHTATRVVQCVNGSPTGPWLVDLPQGDQVKGEEQGVWPVDIDSMPAARRIFELGTEGLGRIVQDNSADISGMMDDDDDDPMMSGGTAGMSSTPGAGTAGGGGSDDGEQPRDDDDGGDQEPGTEAEVEVESDGGGCSTAAAKPGQGIAPLALVLLLVASRRRRRAA